MSRCNVSDNALRLKVRERRVSLGGFAIFVGILFGGWSLLGACSGSPLVQPTSFPLVIAPSKSTFSTKDGWSVKLVEATFSLQMVRFFEPSPDEPTSKKTTGLSVPSVRESRTQGGFPTQKRKRQSLVRLFPGSQTPIKQGKRPKTWRMQSLQALRQGWLRSFFGVSKAWAHPNHATGLAVKAEIVLQKTFSLLETEPLVIGQVRAFTGHYGNAEIIMSKKDQLFARGIATRGKEQVRFALRFHFADHAVVLEPFSWMVESKGKPVQLQVRLSKMFHFLRFSRFLEASEKDWAKPNLASKLYLRSAIYEGSFYSLTPQASPSSAP